MPEPIPTEPATWAVRPLSVHVPPGERRNPVVMVRTEVGPLDMVLVLQPGLGVMAVF